MLDNYTAGRMRSKRRVRNRIAGSVRICRVELVVVVMVRRVGVERNAFCDEMVFVFYYQGGNACHNICGGLFTGWFIMRKVYGWRVMGLYCRNLYAFRLYPS